MALRELMGTGLVINFPKFDNTTIAIYKGSVEVKTNLIRLYAILEHQDNITDELIKAGSKNALNFKQNKELENYTDFEYESKMCFDTLFEKYKHGSGLKMTKTGTQMVIILAY